MTSETSFWNTESNSNTKANKKHTQFGNLNSKNNNF